MAKFLSRPLEQEDRPRMDLVPEKDFKNAFAVNTEALKKVMKALEENGYRLEKGAAGYRIYRGKEHVGEIECEARPGSPVSPQPGTALIRSDDSGVMKIVDDATW